MLQEKPWTSREGTGRCRRSLGTAKGVHPSSVIIYSAGPKNRIYSNDIIQHHIRIIKIELVLLPTISTYLILP